MPDTMKPGQEGKLLFSGISISASRGYLLSLLSGLIYSLVTLIVKRMKNINPAQLVGYRYLCLLSMSLPVLVQNGKNVLGPTGSRTTLLIRAVVTAIAGVLHFFAFRLLPLGEAAVLAGSYPAFVTVAAKIFLKEDFGLLQATSVLTAIIGMVLTTGVLETYSDTARNYSAENIYGIAVGLLSIIFTTASVLLLRKIKHVDTSVLIFTSNFVCIVVSVIVTAFSGGFGLHHCGEQQALILLLGLLSYVGVLFITLALQSAEAGPVATIRAATDIFFSFVWQVVIFTDIPSGIRISGATLVFISVVLVGFRKRIIAFLPEKCTFF